MERRRRHRFERRPQGSARHRRLRLRLGRVRRQRDLRPTGRRVEGEDRRLGRQLDKGLRQKGSGEPTVPACASAPAATAGAALPGPADPAPRPAWTRTSGGDTYVDGGRFDRGFHVGIWCSQSRGRARRASGGAPRSGDRPVCVDEADRRVRRLQQRDTQRRGQAIRPDVRADVRRQPCNGFNPTWEPCRAPMSGR